MKKQSSFFVVVCVCARACRDEYMSAYVLYMSMYVSYVCTCFCVCVCVCVCVCGLRNIILGFQRYSLCSSVTYVIELSQITWCVYFIVFAMKTYNLENLFRKCPSCNGYRRRKWTRRLEFKSWTRLIAFHIILIPLGKVWIQLFSLQLWVNSRID